MAIRRSNDSSRTTTPATATPAPTKPTKPAQPTSSAKPVTASSTTTPAPAAAATTTTTTTTATAPRRRAKPAQVSADVRRAMIAESAYLRSERRGFAPGFEEQDWLAAEKEIDTLLSAGPGASQ